MMKMKPAMARALKLTRSGKLGAATRVIQSSLAKDMAKQMTKGMTGGMTKGFASSTARRSTAGSVGTAAINEALLRYLPFAPAAPATRPTKKRVAKKPVAKKPVAKKPVAKKLVAKKPGAHNPVAAPRTPTPRKTPGKGSFSEMRYVGAEGRMDYWLYRPARPLKRIPVVVMLHGCTQTPGDFARGTGMNALAEEHGFIVAYPSQPASANIARCWNWFKPSDQQRGSGEPALIAAMTRAIVADTGADAARVYVAGLSAGGAAASILGAAYPDIFAAIGVHSGLACGAASDMMSAMSAMRNGSTKSRGQSPANKRSGNRFVPVITFHGDNDATVHAINSAQIIANAAEQIGTPLTIKRQRGGGSGGRVFTRETNCDTDGSVQIEQWTIHGAGHAWSGGQSSGTYTDATGPDASRAMIAFFLQHRMPEA